MTGDDRIGSATIASAFAHLASASPASLEAMVETAGRAIGDLEPSAAPTATQTEMETR